MSGKEDASLSDELCCWRTCHAGLHLYLGHRRIKKLSYATLRVIHLFSVISKLSFFFFEDFNMYSCLFDSVALLKLRK